MTATAESSTRRVSESPPFGTAQDLFQGPPPRHRDVTLNGKVYRFRELMQGEVEEIGAAMARLSTSDDGTQTTITDGRGFKARAIACAWINPQTGQNMLLQPLHEWENINKKLTPREVDVLFGAVDELSLLTKAAKDESGKGQKPTEASTA